MKITTIGWGNGQSNILDAFFTYFPETIEITSIVSMSDDGRTTGVLMKEYKKAFWVHLPPPGDLRRCLFSLSQSPYRDGYKTLFETVMESEKMISEMTIKDMMESVNAQIHEKTFQKMFQHITTETLQKYPEILSLKLPIESTIMWHKFGNILMATIYHHLGDFKKVVDLMNSWLQVRGQVLPVTTQSAYIQAILENGETIETQDNISNVCDYEGEIQRLELMENSKNAQAPEYINQAIQESDYIILGPWDLFTSTIANLIIWGMTQSLKTTKAKIVFLLNTTNKWGETENFRVIDFILHLERYVGRKIDIIVANNKKLALWSEQKKKLQSDISVKWGKYIFIRENERFFLTWRGTQIVEGDFIDRDTLYKHHKKYLCSALLELFSQ